MRCVVLAFCVESVNRSLLFCWGIVVFWINWVTWCAKTHARNWYRSEQLCFFFRYFSFPFTHSHSLVFVFLSRVESKKKNVVRCVEVIMRVFYFPSVLHERHWVRVSLECLRRHFFLVSESLNRKREQLYYRVATFVYNVRVAFVPFQCSYLTEGYIPALAGILLWREIPVFVHSCVHRAVPDWMEENFYSAVEWRFWSFPSICPCSEILGVVKSMCWYHPLFCGIPLVLALVEWMGNLTCPDILLEWALS